VLDLKQFGDEPPAGAIKLQAKFGDYQSLKNHSTPILPKIENPREKLKNIYQIPDIERVKYFGRKQHQKLKSSRT